MEERDKIIHLMVTENCLRDCKYCCNKQYDINKVPYITEEEYKNAHTILLTGGEPVIYSNPSYIAKDIKLKYPNIEKVYVYANARELDMYLRTVEHIEGIDGFSISIKDELDLRVFNEHLSKNKNLLNLASNRVYYFDHFVPRMLDNFDYIHRAWQEHFTPADDSIFRRYYSYD